MHSIKQYKLNVGTILLPVLVLVLFFSALAIANMRLLKSQLDVTKESVNNFGLNRAEGNFSVVCDAAVAQTFFENPANRVSLAVADFLDPITTGIEFLELDNLMGLNITDVTGPAGWSYTPFTGTIEFIEADWAPANPFLYLKGLNYTKPLKLSMDFNNDGYTHRSSQTYMFSETATGNVPFVAFGDYDTALSTVVLNITGPAIITGNVLGNYTSPNTSKLSISGRTIVSGSIPEPPSPSPTPPAPAVQPSFLLGSPLHVSSQFESYKGSFGVEAPSDLLNPGTTNYGNEQSYYNKAQVTITYNSGLGDNVPYSGNSGFYNRTFDGVPSVLYVNCDNLAPLSTVFYYIDAAPNVSIVIDAPSALTAETSPIVIATHGTVTLRIKAGQSRPVIVVTDASAMRTLSSAWVDGDDPGSPTPTATLTPPGGSLTWIGRLLLLAPATTFNSPTNFGLVENWSGSALVLDGSLLVGGNLFLASPSYGPKSINVNIGLNNFSNYSERILHVQSAR